MLAGFATLLACCLLHRGTAAAQNDSQITTGMSSMTLENYPLPSTFKDINAGHQWHCGPKVILDRLAVEKVAYRVQNDTFSSIDSGQRYVNYTEYPAVTPGLENWSCCVYEYRTLAANPAGPAAFSVADSLYIVTTQSEQRFQQLGFKVDILLGSRRRVDSNVSRTDTTDILSRLQLRGPKLVPFTFDKQALLVSTIFKVSREGQVPVATANVSNWRAAAAAVSSTPAIAGNALRRNRRLLQNSSVEEDTIELDVWLSLIPTVNATATATWASLSSLIQRETGAAGFPMLPSLVNATVWQRPAFEPVATEIQEAAGSSTGIDAIGKSSGGGLTTGAIAGIAVLCAVLAVAAALVAFALVRRQRQRRGQQQRQQQGKQQPLPPIQVKDELGSAGSTSTEGSAKLAADASGGSGYASSPHSSRLSIGSGCGGENAMLPAEVSICHKPDGSVWLLGAGNFGRVYKGLWRGHHEVAVKQLTCFADDQLLASLQREIGILKRVSFNRNVVQFYGFSLGNAVQDTASRPEEGPMLVMEYLEGGDLRRALWKHPEDYAWVRRGHLIALDIARGMHFLHSSGVTHRDIKTSNVLLTRDGTAKIADVGLAITADYFSAGTAKGTFAYAAPELLMGGKCSTKVDVYSFGVVLWEIVTKQSPTRGHLREIKPGECPPEVVQLLARCIDGDASKRPTAAEVVERLVAIENISKSSSESPSPVSHAPTGPAAQHTGQADVQQHPAAATEPAERLTEVAAGNKNGT